jgi:hypothetical protein
LQRLGAQTTIVESVPFPEPREHVLHYAGRR